MKKVLIISASYYVDINKSLLIEAKKALDKAKINYKIINTPGIFEIPVVIAKNLRKFDGFVALGCVIKGDTPHFEFISRSTFDGIMNLSIKSRKPIGNGIITSLNKKQAIERSNKPSSKKPNKGSEAADAVIAILKNGLKKI